MRWWDLSDHSHLSSSKKEESWRRSPWIFCRLEKKCWEPQICTAQLTSMRILHLDTFELTSDTDTETWSFDVRRNVKLLSMTHFCGRIKEINVSSDQNIMLAKIVSSFFPLMNKTYVLLKLVIRILQCYITQRKHKSRFFGCLICCSGLLTFSSQPFLIWIINWD